VRQDSLFDSGVREFGEHEIAKAIESNIHTDAFPIIYTRRLASQLNPDFLLIINTHKQPQQGPTLNSTPCLLATQQPQTTQHTTLQSPCALTLTPPRPPSPRPPPLRPLSAWLTPSAPAPSANAVELSPSPVAISVSSVMSTITSRKF
jgi:hypothetical protein